MQLVKLIPCHLIKNIKKQLLPFRLPLKHYKAPAPLLRTTALSLNNFIGYGVTIDILPHQAPVKPSPGA